MSGNGEKCPLVFPKAQDDVLQMCFILSTPQRYSVYCHTGGKKTESVQIYFTKEKTTASDSSCEAHQHFRKLFIELN